MNSWPELIEAHHAWAHPDDGWRLVTGEPAKAEELAELETRLGIELPTEFKDLYRTYNGVGIATDAGDGSKARNVNFAKKVAELEATLGQQIPVEHLKSRQDLFNETAVSEEDKKMCWQLVPVAEIPDLMMAAQSWFQETHADVARRFVPFIDWSCGDFTGYLLPLESGESPELHTFEHENYEFDEAQEAEEFLLLSYESIRDYFSTR